MCYSKLAQSKKAESVATDVEQNVSFGRDDFQRVAERGYDAIVKGEPISVGSAARGGIMTTRHASNVVGNAEQVEDARG